MTVVGRSEHAHFWMLLPKCLQRSHKHQTSPPSFFRDFHTYIAALDSPQQMSPEKPALKNSHRWCYSPPAAVTSETAPRLSHPRGLSYSSGHWCETRQLDRSLHPCLQICYSLIAMPSQHQHHLCLNASNLALSKSVRAAGPLLTVYATSLVSTCLSHMYSGYKNSIYFFFFSYST